MDIPDITQELPNIPNNKSNLGWVFYWPITMAFNGSPISKTLRFATSIMSGQV